MLLRHDNEGIIAISQPAHAWVAGQLARNWRQDDFVGVREEVCLELNFCPVHGEGLKMMVHPWPFATPALTLICEGRRLLGTYKDEQEMREGLRAAAPVVLATTLAGGA